MFEFLSLLIGIVVIGNFIFTIWSYFSLRRLVKWNSINKSKDDALLNHIIHTRSSINLIYASIATITFVLTFLGFNLKDKIAQELTKEISASSRVDLDLLKAKVNDINFLDSTAVIKSRELNQLIDKARLKFNELSNTPQKVYVVQGIQVSQKKHFYSFSELVSINNEKLPIFLKLPAITYSFASYADGAISNIRPMLTKDGLEFGETQEPYKIDLCFYPRN